MSRKNAGIGEKKPATVSINNPDNPKGALKSIRGSQSDNWNNTLANQALHSLWIKNSDAGTRDRQYHATLAALVERFQIINMLYEGAQ
jgi:hypothetical protein